MDVRIDTAVVASETSTLSQAALALESATETAATTLAGLAGMAGIDPMAEDWANGSETEGGYDAVAHQVVNTGTTLAQAIAGLEGHVLAISAGYRAVELAGAPAGTSNPYADMTPTQISARTWSLGTALGDEQRGTALGDIRQWVEDTLRDTAGIIIPTADTGKVRQAETAWTNYASALRTASTKVSASLPSTTSFEYPQRADVIAVRTKISQLLTQAAGDADGVAAFCGSYAQNVDNIRAELEAMIGQLVTEVAIDIGVGIALSFLTAGIGALAGSAKAALTVVKWAKRIKTVLDRLKSLINSSKLAVRLSSRVGVEAIRSTVSGTIANAGASMIYGNFSWSGLAHASVASGIGGGIAGPFSHIGSQITSRTMRITTRAGVDGVTGATGGIAGDWTASQFSGQEFNLIMSTVTGGFGGMASGGVSGIRGPQTTATPNPASTISQGQTPTVTPTTSSTDVNPSSTPTPGGGAPAATSNASASTTVTTGADGSGAPAAGNGGTPTPVSGGGAQTVTTGAADGGPTPPADLPGDSGSTPGDTGSTPVDTGSTPVDTGTGTGDTGSSTGDTGSSTGDTPPAQSTDSPATDPAPVTDTTTADSSPETTTADSSPETTAADSTTPESTSTESTGTETTSTESTGTETTSTESTSTESTSTESTTADTTTADATSADATTTVSIPDTDIDLPTQLDVGGAGAAGAVPMGTRGSGATNSTAVDLDGTTAPDTDGFVLPPDDAPPADADGTGTDSTESAADNDNSQGDSPERDSTESDASDTDAADTDAANIDAADTDPASAVPPVTETPSTDPTHRQGERLTDTDLTDLAAKGFHVAFFDQIAYNAYYNGADPRLGPPRGKFWVMPLEDGMIVRDTDDAVRATGHAPATLRAHLGYAIDGATGEPILSDRIADVDRGLLAVVFEPEASNPPVKPTRADAGEVIGATPETSSSPYPHFLESTDPDAGHTAVNTGGANAGYLMNPHIREFVINGGRPIGPGSFIVDIVDGQWVVRRVF